MRPSSVTISGSFRKYYSEICEARDIFELNGIFVFSPKKSTIINPLDDFVLLESDSKNKTMRELEDLHLRSIKDSTFLYVVSPKGYVGDTTRLEIGYAHAKHVPIFSSELIEDKLLREYVDNIYTPQELCDLIKK